MQAHYLAFGYAVIVTVGLPLRIHHKVKSVHLAVNQGLLNRNGHIHVHRTNEAHIILVLDVPLLALNDLLDALHGQQALQVDHVVDFPFLFRNVLYLAAYMCTLVAIANVTVFIFGSCLPRVAILKGAFEKSLKLTIVKFDNWIPGPLKDQTSFRKLLQDQIDTTFQSVSILHCHVGCLFLIFILMGCSS